MSTYSTFRSWIHQTWIKNCEERAFTGLLPMTKSTYFNKYKWWLKNQYKKARSDPWYDKGLI